jgi:Ca2+-binding RTX toxin-like protein
MNRNQPAWRTTRFWARTAVVSVAAAAPMAAFASSASANTTASVSNKQLIVATQAGKTNDIFIRRSPNNRALLIRDRGDTLTPGAGCQAAGREVQCSAVGSARPQEIIVNAGDGNDRVVANGNLKTTLRGEAGNDFLIGGFEGAARNIILGGTGDDRLIGGSGDVLRGDAGNDLLTGSKFSDFLHGGDGDDTLRGGDGNDELRGDAGNDHLDGGVGNDDLCVGETEINCEA